MSGIRSFYRGTQLKGYASAGSAPLRIDPNTNTLKVIPAGTGSSEIEYVDVSTAQTLTTKTLTAPTINGAVPGTISVPNLLESAFSTVNNPGNFNADTYLTGSAVALPPGGFKAGHCYSCLFDMAKTAAGTAALAITVRLGTAGTTSDAAILTFTFGAGTAAGDTGIFEVYFHFRTVGSGTAAVIAGAAECSHLLAATGLVSTGASGWGTILGVSSGFDSTVSNNFLGLSVNGGASFVGTNTIVEAKLLGF